MKKLICLLLAIACVLSLAACSQAGGVPQEDYDKLKKEYEELNAKYEQIASTASPTIPTEENPEPSQSEVPEQTKPSGKFNAETVISQLEIEEYPYSTRYSEYVFLTVRNNSEYNIRITISARFYNGDELVGAKSTQQEAFEKGTEIVLYFMQDEAFTSVKYDISVSEETSYMCVVSGLVYESTTAKNKEIVSVTNNGRYAAEFVECYALFFKDGKVVGHDSAYFVDDEYELKPGKTITQELSCYKDYDDVKFFFTGRKYIF